VAAIAAAFVRGALAPAPGSQVKREFRDPYPRPSLPTTLRGWERLPRAFDDWWGDSFGFRPQLIRWHNALKLFGFGVTPTAELFLGPGQQLFTTREQSLEVFRGAAPMSERELWVWAHVLRARRQWCAERGMRYLYVLCPNKETIYPERVSRRYPKIGPTRREQLLAHVAGASDVPFFDLTPALEQAKREWAAEGDVYYRLGTHWDGRGTLAAWRALDRALRALAPDMRELGEDKVRVAPHPGQGDSWAGRLYLEDVLLQENVELDLDLAVELAPVDPQSSHSVFAELPDVSAPRLLMFHDSFGEHIRKILAGQFSRSRFHVGPGFDTALIESERPDLVVHLQVERALAGYVPCTSPLDTRETLAPAFAESRRVLLDLGRWGQPSGEGGLRAAPLADGTFFVESPGRDGALFVPALEVPPGCWAILRIEIEAPEPSELTLEFLTSTQRAAFERGDARCWSRQGRSWSAPLAQGPNELWVKLLVPQLWGPMKLFTGGAPGAFRLRALEARAVDG
jgi:hypothetical protein